MTGRDLIIYILSNKLEDTLILNDGKIHGFMSANEAALKFSVGEATIHAWYRMGFIPGFYIGKEIYIPVNAIKGVDVQ